MIELDADLKDYYDAMAGTGPQAYEWQDKPHRLIYDLVQIAQRERNEKNRLNGVIEEANREIGKLAAEAKEILVAIKALK